VDTAITGIKLKRRRKEKKKCKHTNYVKENTST
jgi:hypothetical protein